MTPSNPFPMQQIHIGIGPNGYEPVADYHADKATYAREHTQLHNHLLRICEASVWPNGSSYKSGCPRPILIGQHHLDRMEDLHEALTLAITDIVRRWWTDVDARFPERMPLEPYEEELLQWLDIQTLQGNVGDISSCLGSWRPDFLVEDHRSQEGDVTVEENYRITEINARFCFNGFMHEAYGQQALDDMGIQDCGLINATHAEDIIGGLFSLFDPDLPLHLLKGEEHGIDITMFIDIVERRLGVTPRLITPQQLRLVPDPQAKGGYKLCCLAEENSPTTIITRSGESVEEIHQVGLELHQRELKAMNSEILRQISLRCFNDMRTILLIHDKRMLGIVKQELQGLVTRQVLTPAQAEVLNMGIADTILPGSPQLQDLVQLFKSSQDTHAVPSRYEYILKPVRSGKGAGIVFGEDFPSDEDWIAALERLECARIAPGICVVQKKIEPRSYDAVLHSSGERVRYPLVGTYHVAQGKLLGLGTWRSSGNRICAVSGGGAWICSVIVGGQESVEVRGGEVQMQDVSE